MDIGYRGISFGSDPEFFFVDKDGAVVGAEKVLPVEGLRQAIGNTFDGEKYVPTFRTIVVIDGVQGELNVVPDSCRQRFSSNLATALRMANGAAMEKGLTISFAQTVEVSKEEMASLSDKAQQFGCSPSHNFYEEGLTVGVEDASKYFSRSAGGHLHLGIGQTSKEDAERIMPVLDILVGNTCVLIDRDRGNIDRRKTYGRAGEYRLPKHGLEYRTLSNFWLRHYVLMSFVTALARFAFNAANNKQFRDALLARVSIDKVRYAINENDFDMALANFEEIKDLIAKATCGTNPDAVYPLQGKRIASFEHLVKEGLDVFFTQNPMAYWNTHHSGNRGWERFADEILAPALAEANTPKPAEAVTAQ